MPPKAPQPTKSALEKTTLKIHAELNDATVGHRWGSFQLSNADQPRRVVWVRVQSTVETPKQAGGRLQSAPPNGPGIAGAATGGDTGVGSRWRATRIRVQTVDAHIYAEDEGLVDQLLKNLIAATDLVWPQVEYVFEDWPLDTELQGNITRYAKAVLRMKLRHAVADEVLRLQPVAGEEHECGILQPDGSLSSS